jgi:hypothetical protein
MCIHSGLKTSTAAAGSFVDFLVKRTIWQEDACRIDREDKTSLQGLLGQKKLSANHFLQNSMEPLMSLR